MCRGSSCNNKWLDRAALPCLAWLATIRYFQPDVFLHECTPAFPLGIFHEVLNDTSRGHHAKHPSARPLPHSWFDGLEDDAADNDVQQLAEWCFLSEVFSPDQLGKPVRRSRRYTAGYWRPGCQLRLAIDFRSMFCRQLLLDASVYFQADPDMLGQSVSRELADLNIGQESRLEAQLCAAARAGQCDSNFEHWSVSFAIVDLTQSVGWRGVSTEVLPALLRRSKLWDLVSAQPVGEVALWLAQGFPHPRAVGLAPAVLQSITIPCGATGPSDSASSRTELLYCRGPEHTVVERLSLIGNAMNLTQVSAWLAFAFASIDRVLPS